MRRFFKDRDPDVIEGHDLFRSILPLIVARAGRRKVKLLLGRDGSALTSRFSRVVVAEKTINYPKFEIYGRHLVDTALLTQFYDISARELEGYGLAGGGAALSYPLAGSGAGGGDGAGYISMIRRGSGR